MTPQQEHKTIKVKDLRLWSENPRDPIGEDIGDLEIIKRATRDDRKTWSLEKLLKDMGGHYDMSELPTVVYHGKIPIVYDANRRVAILKYAQNPEWSQELEGSFWPRVDIPDNFKNLAEIPSNVCNKETALQNVRRKHLNDSSWHQLERDIFDHKYGFSTEKSIFLKFDEATHLIRTYSKIMNERIMKDHILTEARLKMIGFSFDKNDNLISIYEEEFAWNILDTIVKLRYISIKESQSGGIIGSRGRHKYNIKEALKSQEEFKNKIKPFDPNNATPVNYPKGRKISLDGTNVIPLNSTNEKGYNSGDSTSSEPRHTPRQTRFQQEIFGGKLELESGDVNDLYRDIVALYDIYLKNEDGLSSSFPNLIRMALRLLVECAGEGSDEEFTNQYIDKYFEDAKAKLGKDQKTTLSNHSITSARKLNQLLQTGAHNYSSSANLEQTLAMSVIIGEMLKITHSK